jgi:hypothetical protein
MQPLRENNRKSWERFEDETFENWFPDHLFKCLHRTPYSFDLKKRFIQSAAKPDFQFSIRNFDLPFWVECKERNLFYGTASIRLFNIGQRERYSKEKNVLIFLKLIDNGYPKHYLVPLDKFNYDFATIWQLSNFRLASGFPIMPSLIKKYFG